MSILDQLDRAKEHEDRAPFIKDGIHELAIKEYRSHTSTKNGEGVQVILMVIKSTNPAHKPGSVVCQGWYPNHPPRFVGDTGQDDLNKIVDFMIKARGLTGVGPDVLDKGKKSVRYALGDEGKAKAPLRGIRIIATGVTRDSKGKNPDGTQKQWTDVTWTHVPGQTPEQIKDMRAKVAAVPDIDAAGAPVAQAAATVAAQPAQPVAQAAALTPAASSGSDGW